MWEIKSNCINREQNKKDQGQMWGKKCKSDCWEYKDEKIYIQRMNINILYGNENE